MSTETTARETVELSELPDKPLVSILIPSYNQGKFIGDTIDSILSQDYRPIEIRVVDGASTDETVEVLKSYGDIPELKWVSEPDKGVVDAVNKGFRQLAGDICGIQSSDDMYLPDAITTTVSQFRENADVGLVYGDTVKVDAAGNELLKYRIGAWSLKAMLSLQTWIPQPSAFFRREMLAACGDWDASIPYAPDTDLWLRMAYRTQVRKIDVYLSQRRMHDAQRDTQGDSIIRDYCKMIDQSPDIAQSDPELRRAAAAGKHLICVRYGEHRGDWYRAWHRLRAGMICSELRDLASVSSLVAMPGRRAISRIKKLVVGQSAAAT